MFICGSIVFKNFWNAKSAFSTFLFLNWFQLWSQILGGYHWGNLCDMETIWDNFFHIGHICHDVHCTVWQCFLGQSKSIQIRAYRAWIKAIYIPTCRVFHALSFGISFVEIEANLTNLAWAIFCLFGEFLHWKRVISSVNNWTWQPFLCLNQEYSILEDINIKFQGDIYIKLKGFSRWFLWYQQFWDWMSVGPGIWCRSWPTYMSAGGWPVGISNSDTNGFIYPKLQWIQTSPVGMIWPLMSPS